MWQHPPCPAPGLAPNIPFAPDTAAWNRTVDKMIALEVNATRNDIAHAVWHVMTSMPWALSNNTLLSSEIRRVLAACSKKHSELDKVRADLARQQNDLDMRKLEIKSKQNKVDKQQKQLHKFEKWFLQVDAIERVERVGQESKLGPKSETDSEVDTESEWNGPWSHPVTNEEWNDPANASNDDWLQTPARESKKPVNASNEVNWPQAWARVQAYQRNELSASFQKAQRHPGNQAQDPVKPALDSWGRGWGIDKDQPTNNDINKSTSEKLIKDEVDNHSKSIKLQPIQPSIWDDFLRERERQREAEKESWSTDKSLVKGESPVKDPLIDEDPLDENPLDEEDHKSSLENYSNPLYNWSEFQKKRTRASLFKIKDGESEKHNVNDGGMSTTWNDPTKSVQVPDEWQQRCVDGLTNKPTKSGYNWNDKSDKSNIADVSGYHWDDGFPMPTEPISSCVGTNGYYLDELNNKSVTDRADSDEPDNAGESPNVDDWTVPVCTWTDDDEFDHQLRTEEKLMNDKLAHGKVTTDKATDTDVGESANKGLDSWSSSEHTSDVDNLTTWDMPIVTPESFKSGSVKSGSGTRHSTVADNLTTLKMPVVAVEASKFGLGTRPRGSKGPYKKRGAVRFEDPSCRGAVRFEAEKYDEERKQRALAREKLEEKLKQYNEELDKERVLEREKLVEKQKQLDEERKQSAMADNEDLSWFQKMKARERHEERKQRKVARERELARERESVLWSSPISLPSW